MYTKEVIEEILRKVSRRKLSAERAYERLKNLSYETLRFARIDHHRPLRKNLPEVVYAPGKTTAQLSQIVNSLLKKNVPVLITRLDKKKFIQLKKHHPKLSYSEVGRIAYYSPHLNPPPQGGRKVTRTNSLPPLWGKVRMGVNGKLQKSVAIVTAGTSDIPIAEEARITLEVIGRKVVCFYDLGVAGLHRLLDHVKEIETADAVICIAGMEGALPSVLAGLISKPIIAVPTSVGYGAGFQGITPLLTMLNSCSQGVAVVNIDSGFNAACFAHLILNS